MGPFDSLRSLTASHYRSDEQRGVILLLKELPSTQTSLRGFSSFSYTASMDSVLTSSLFFGILGGLLRGCIGVIKYMEQNRKRGALHPQYLAFSLIVAGAVGGITGVFTQANWEFAFLAGYAGTDFLEGLYKIRFKQRFEI